MTNPGSTVKIDVDVMPHGTTYFSKFYVCFKGLKDGWIEGCRRVIGLDGCFLKGICRGQLLSAIDRDANNHIYPIVWAVVSVESKETWKWFIDLLIEDLGMGVGHGLTLISDQHKGKLFRKLIWYVVASTTPVKFEQHMNEIKKLEPLAYDHLMERDPKTWSKAFFRLIGLVMHMKMVYLRVLTHCPSLRIFKGFGNLYHLVINSMKSDLGMMHMLWKLVAGHVLVELGS
uniref:MULE transposase domain-containing protein n=1 Tax=Lactuca sativa TaxID=4236 RepID=A0A9R1VJQ3_LACSA|nr:hypothetical protein LSAT_V11C500291090 [Lactuca sativa]